ncbi:MAG: DNA primase noncatalytic subunit PriX [Candidatus Micrarchaeia archaeon]
MYTKEDLDFAYICPFSTEAKKIIEEAGNSIEQEYFEKASKHIIKIASAENPSPSYFDTEIEAIKISYLKTYAYARILLSAISNPVLISKFVGYEAKRTITAFSAMSSNQLLKLADQVGLPFGVDLSALPNRYYIRLAKFLDILEKENKTGIYLSNLVLKNGIVYMSLEELQQIFETAIRKMINSGMPIPKSMLPKEAISYSNELKKIIAPPLKHAGAQGETSWIEALLKMPIADARHRTVNLILAPYMVNVKNYDVDTATKIISEYIDRCKQIEPSTKVSESYIRYQCDYAKKRGLKPLSKQKAMEILSGILEDSFFEH